MDTIELTTEHQGFAFHFVLERDEHYVLHEKFDYLNTRTIKMYKTGKLKAYVLTTTVTPLNASQQPHIESLFSSPISFLEPSLLFSAQTIAELKEELTNYLEESPLIEDILNKIDLYLRQKF